MKIVKMCLICSHEYSVKPSKDSKSKYCSKKCSNLSKIGVKTWNAAYILKNCPICKKQIRVRQGRLKESKNQFCSRKCMGVFNAKPLVGKECPVCLHKFYIKPCYLNGRHFCSPTCKSLSQKGRKPANATYILKPCLMCGKQIQGMKCRLRDGEDKFCSRRCAGLYLYHIEERKPWKSLVGKIAHNRGVPQYSNRGERNHNWKGGITCFSMKIRGSLEYQLWRRSIFERDNFTCQICGERGEKLNVDHYPTRFAYILKDNRINTPEDAYSCQPLWDISNGRTLCLKCHKKTDSYLKPML